MSAPILEGVAGRLADRPLDEAMVAELVGGQFPDLAHRPVTRLGAGWDNEVFAVGPDLVFRFPKRADQVSRQTREVQVLSLVEEGLGPLVPHLCCLGRPSQRFPYPFVGYRRLPGVSIDCSGGRDLIAALAPALGAALGRLHQVDPARVPPTPTGWEREPLDQRRADLVLCAATIAPLLDRGLRERAAPFLSGEVPIPTRSGPPCLCHNDICAEHVLVDRRGNLRGLIDWTDAMVTDPVVDFVGLITIGGWSFVDRVVAAYPLRLDAGFAQRLERLTRTLALTWLAEAVEEDAAHLDRHLAWVARAFAGHPSPAIRR